MAKHPILTLAFYLLVYVSLSHCHKDRYVSLERPVIAYYNTKYLSYTNVSTQRYGRHDLMYYSNIYFRSVYSFDNNVTVHFFFYEFTNNMNMRLNFEVHFKLCDLIHKDKWLGPILKQGKFDRPCPYPAGDYYLYNVTLPVQIIPNAMPFTRSRMYLNISATTTKEQITGGYIDMEIKTYIQKKKN